MIASTRLAANVVKYWAFISIIIGVIFIATVLSAGGTTFANNFNAYSGSNMTYNQVISVGQQQFGAYNGVPPVFSTSTLYAAALGLLGFLGFNSSAYFAGEVKQNRRIADSGTIWRHDYLRDFHNHHDCSRVFWRRAEIR